MFNPLTPAEMVTAMGRSARDAASSDAPASTFARAQLKSTYSASRHLAVELASFDAELRAFSGAVAAAVRAAPADLTGREDLIGCAERLDGSSDPQVAGALVSELLGVLRGLDTPAAAALRGEVRQLLRALADREVDLLADVIEAPQP